MSRQDSNKEIENLDHAFEVALILVTVISATFAQYATVEQLQLPPIIADLRILSIIFIFPSILAIIVWIGVHFTDDENRKMYLRTYAWSLLLFLIFIELLEFYVICVPTEGRSEWWFNLIFIPFLLYLIVPLIPLLLIEKILGGYEVALKYTAHDFFVMKNNRKSAICVFVIKKYLPFALSWLTFWLVYFAGTST